jgi:23S rRNA pseudouridine1911/1915/1917 synthase
MNYSVEKEETKKRLDMYLASKNTGMTRSYIKTLIENEKILVNDQKVKAGYMLKLGDNIEIADIEEKPAEIVPEKIHVDIVYEDDYILIINKEKGMVVHPANGNYTGTLVNSLMYSHADKLSSINGVIRPGIVHRIDKDTTGILIVAKNDNAHKNLSEQFKVHSINRKYVALVKGIVKEDEFTIDLPIGRSQKDRKKMAVTDKNSRNAITHIKVLNRYYESNITMIEATLETGRTHQIRVHMAHAGYPLLGDEVYGKPDIRFKTSGQMLHAKLLGIIHPKTGKYMEFEAALPKGFQDVVDILEKREKTC